MRGNQKTPLKIYLQMPLNDRQIKNAKHTDTGKKTKLFDGGGLSLEVTPAGSKVFRLKYRIDGKEKSLTIGKYPAVSLSEARREAENARRMLAQGQDPAAAKQQAKQERQAALLNTFAATTCLWHAGNPHRWKSNHAERIMRYFETDVFPLIGEIPIDSITVGQIKQVLDRITARGVSNTAEKVREWIGAVFDYAAMLEVTDRNPARALRKYIAKQPPKSPSLDCNRWGYLKNKTPAGGAGVLFCLALFLIQPNGV